MGVMLTQLVIMLNLLHSNISVHFNENSHTSSDFSFAPTNTVEAERSKLLT